jgi:hypothetical protein
MDPLTGMKKGGEQGWVKLGEREANSTVKSSSKTEVMLLKIFSDNNLYLVQVIGGTPTIPTIQVQNLTRTIMPSKATEDGILAAATKFATGNQNKDKFVAAAEDLGPMRSKEVALHEEWLQRVMGVGIAPSGDQMGASACQGKAMFPLLSE